LARESANRVLAGLKIYQPTLEKRLLRQHRKCAMHSGELLLRFRFLPKEKRKRNGIFRKRGRKRDFHGALKIGNEGPETAFLNRLAQRFGEDSANYLVDQIRHLGNRRGKLELSRDPSSERQGNGIRQILSRVTKGDSKNVQPVKAGQPQAAADSDPLIYSIVVISISQFAGRKKS
jgi:hypothetical protein